MSITITNPNDAPRPCRIERTSLGGGVICAECGDECECIICRDDA